MTTALDASPRPAAARSPGAGEPGGWDGRRFPVALAAVVALALAWRVAYVLCWTRYDVSHVYDDVWYDLQAQGLLNGHFFSVPFGGGPDAAHPPLTSLVLVPVTAVFGLHPGIAPQRLTMAVLGAAVVLCTGLLGRAVAGPRVGIVAAAVAAAYPNMWMPSGIVMSETLTMLLVALLLLGIYRLFRAPTVANAALVGLACGLAMLTRAELALYVPFLVVPAALAPRGVPGSRRLLLAGVAVGVAVVVVAPWVGRNLASFKDATFLSTGEGPVLLGANCPPTYFGTGTGGWAITCVVDTSGAGDQSVVSARQASVGIHYATHHLGRLPMVMLARVGRVWDAFRPVQMLQSTVNEGRPVPAALAGLVCYYVLVPLAVVGTVVLRRRRTRVWPMLVIAAAVTLVAAAGYGQVRFRAELEVPLVVLAAVGIDAAVTRAAGLRRRGPRPGAALPPVPG